MAPAAPAVVQREPGPGRQGRGQPQQREQEQRSGVPREPFHDEERDQEQGQAHRVGVGEAFPQAPGQGVAGGVTL
jgi:hypothetical protein